MKKIKLRPITNHIVVKRQEAEKASPGGIMSPDSEKEKPQRGEVLAVGPGAIIDGSAEDRQAMAVKVGDVVWFQPFAWIELKVDGEELIVMSEDDVMAVEE